MNRQIALFIAAMAFVAFPLNARQGANLTGHWVRLPSASAVTAIDPLEADSEDILQTLLDVQITQRWGTRVATQTRAFDGVERDATASLSGSARTTTAWQGDRLVTTTQRTVSLPYGTAAVDVREVRYLDAGRMILEITWTSGTTTVNRRVRYAQVLR